MTNDKKKNIIRALVFAMFAALIGFILTETLGVTGSKGEALVAKHMGYPKLSTYIIKETQTKDFENVLNDTYEKYCKEKKMNPEDDNSMVIWMNSEMDTAAKLVADCKKADQAQQEAQNVALQEEFSSNADALMDAYDKAARIAAYIWSIVITMLLGLFLALCETRKVGKIIGATVASGIMGIVSGMFAQAVYSHLMPENSDDVFTLVVRGLGWSVMGLGLGLVIGFLRKRKKAILTCAITGFVSAFLGGAIFEIVVQMFTSNAMFARGIALLLMGALLGICFQNFGKDTEQDVA